MHRVEKLLVVLAVLASLALTGPGAAAASGTITFDGSPGSGAPPATLGPYTMTAFGADPQPTSTDVAGVAGPTGQISFSPALEHLQVGNGWNTWSNGYTGDVYATGGATSATVTLPAGTSAFYLYAEPDPYEVIDVTATAQDGTTSGPVAVNGYYGAQYFGFYGTGGATIASVTITSATDFAIGEFGISGAALQAAALPPSGLHVDDSLDPTKPVGAFVDPAGTAGDTSPYQATVDFGAGNGPEAATVVDAGANCPASLDSSSGACFLVLPTAATAKEPYQQAGSYTMTVSVSDGSTGQQASATGPVTVQNASYVVELKAWIPYPLVVDPVNPYPGFLSAFTAHTVFGFPTCGAPSGFFLPLPVSLLTVISFLRGDTHSGFAGSFRVDTQLSFDWTGTQIVNAQVVPTSAISTRTITYTILGRKSWQCDEPKQASTSTTTNASGTGFHVDYSSATPLVPAAPTIDGMVDGTFAPDGTISLTFTTDGFPSHGFSIQRDGVTQQIDLLNDASCVGQAGVLGPLGAVRIAAGLTGLVQDTGSFTDTPDQQGTSGIDQFPGSPVC